MELKNDFYHLYILRYMHFLSSPCHKSLLKGVICLHEKLQLNPFIFTFFFSFPTSLSFYLHPGSSWNKCLYLLSDRDMTYNFRCWKSRIFSSNCISYLSMKRKCRQGKHSKSSSDFKKIKSPNANQWDAGNDACQTFKRNESVVFIVENAQINLQSSNSNFCIRFPGSNSLFADKHLLMTTMA